MRPAMPVDLKELRRLHEAATPEPWYEQYEYDGSRTVCQMRSTHETICVNRATHVSGNPWERTKENGMLIAAMRNALPELLDRIEAAEAENAELERDRERLHNQLKNLVREIVYNAQQVPGRREWSLMLSSELMDELRMMLDGWHRRDAAREEEVNRS